MAYTPTQWKDGDVISADRLNKLEQGVANEQVGPAGEAGPQGPAGADGEDGFSPTVAVTDITGGHRVTITDAEGPHSFDVMDGKDGTGGEGTAGVTSFNGRDGAVIPQEGDYTAAMVGARAGTWTPTAAEVSVAPPAGMTATDVQGAVAELFQSVSEGKALIASAVTDKGVPTAADATFQTMHDNILAIETESKQPDNWLISTLPSILSGAEWREIAFGDGRFVAVSNNSNQAAYSDDGGATWTASTLPSSAKWREITFGDGVFVTVAQDSNKAAYSDDGGATWKASTLPSSGSWTAVAYGDGRFVTVAQASNKAAYSDDGGATWKASTLPSSGSWTTISYGNGQFITIKYNTSPIADYAYSTNGGISWTASTLPVKAVWRRVTFGADTFVAVSNTTYYNVSGAPNRPYLTDGAYVLGKNSWNKMYLPWPAKWNDVTYGDGMFVTVSISNADNSEASDILAYSKNGAYWTAVRLPVVAAWYGVACGNGKIVAISTNGRCAYSL